MAAALEVAAEVGADMPAALASDFAGNVAELRELRRRTVAYALHLRETNLVTTMRVCRAQGREIPQRTLAELHEVLTADRENQGQPEPVGGALRLLAENVDAFLSTYFTVVPDRHSKGNFSLTSR